MYKRCIVLLSSGALTQTQANKQHRQEQCQHEQLAAWIMSLTSSTYQCGIALPVVNLQAANFHRFNPHTILFHHNQPAAGRKHKAEHTICMFIVSSKAGVHQLVRPKAVPPTAQRMKQLTTGGDTS